MTDKTHPSHESLSHLPPQAYFDEQEALAKLLPIAEELVALIQEARAPQCLHQIQEPAEYPHLPSSAADVVDFENGRLDVDFGDPAPAGGTSLYSANQMRAYVDADRAQRAAPVLAAQHPDDAAVDAMAALMKAKLEKQRAKGYGGWDTDCTRERLSELLRGHVDKDDPVDVANFCAFLSARGETIAPQAAPAAVAVPANPHPANTSRHEAWEDGFAGREMQMCVAGSAYARAYREGSAALAATPAAATALTPRAHFIKGWDAARMYLGMQGSVDSDRAMRKYMVAIPSSYVEAAAAPVVQPEPDAAAQEVMELVERHRQEVIKVMDDEGSLVDVQSAQDAIKSKLLALLAGVSAPAAQAVPVKPQPITLTVNQLRQAIEFGTGGFTPDTTDELETQLSICWGSLEDDDGNVTECMRCWLFDYPEEGAIPLDEQPTERDLASLATPQAQADSRDALDVRAIVEKLPRYTYGYKGDDWGMNQSLRSYESPDGAFLRRDEVLTTIAAQAEQGGAS